MQKVKDVKCEEESEDVFHLGFRTDNESINENEMNTFSGSTSYTIADNLNYK